MDKEKLALYTDYLISNFGQATATGLSALLDGDVSHDKVTRFLSEREYTSKDLWREVKSMVRQIESAEGVLIFDATIEEKAWTDENEIVCWHYDHGSGHTVKGINLLNALYHSGDVSIPVAFEVVKKPLQFCDLATRRVKRASLVTKNAHLREMMGASDNRADLETIGVIAGGACLAQYLTQEREIRFRVISPLENFEEGELALLDLKELEMKSKQVTEMRRTLQSAQRFLLEARRFCSKNNLSEFAKLKQIIPRSSHTARLERILARL
jgi:hypothetical protein